MNTSTIQPKQNVETSLRQRQIGEPSRVHGLSRRNVEHGPSMDAWAALAYLRAQYIDHTDLMDRDYDMPERRRHTLTPYEALCVHVHRFAAFEGIRRIFEREGYLNGILPEARAIALVNAYADQYLAERWRDFNLLYYSFLFAIVAFVTLRRFGFI